jgi:Flp pilus assembly protein TadD
VKANPRDLALRANLAEGYLSTGEAQKAQVVVRDAPPEHASAPRLLLARGRAELALGEWSNAVATFDQLVRGQPGSAGAQLLLATALAGAGNVTGMEQHLLEGVKIDADNPLVPVAIGSVVGALGDTTAKTALMDRLSEVMAGHPQLALAQAQVAMESGDHAKAIKGLRNLFNSRPKDVAVFEALLRAQVAANELVPAAVRRRTGSRPTPRMTRFARGWPRSTCARVTAAMPSRPIGRFWGAARTTPWS